MQHTNEGSYTGSMTHHGEDAIDSTAKSFDSQSKRMTGSSALHWATLVSIGASITLFLAGKRELAIFVGLWPPTFQALKANAERSRESSGSSMMSGREY